MVDFRKELANYNFVEKYSMLKEDETRETWDESVDRIWDMHKVKLAGLNLSEEFRNDIELCRIMEKDKLYLSAQRARQWASTGRGILDKHYRLYNCSGSYADRQEFFKQFIFLLLCGCGAGYNICFRHVQKLPAIKSVTLTHEKYYVEDTIEGWGDAVDYVFNSYMNTGAIGEIDYSRIREKGSLISGRFVHGGYEPLKKAIDNVVSILNNCSGRKLKPIEVFDICCHLSQAVLSGGVRRSATIAMFSWDDKEMMNAKSSADWFEKNPQRAMANISPVMVRSKVKKADIDYLVSCAKLFGEPGILFAENEDFVTNPCGEIGMIPKTIDGKSGWQFCNLVEINCSKVESEEDFYEVCRIASIAATIQATYDSFEYLGKTTEQIVRGSALIGVSITGYLDCPIELTEEILRKGANIVKDANFKAANELKIMPARRCTTMKPSGNASILLETESASNPAHSKRYLRHVRLNRHRGMYSFIKRNCPELIVCDKPDNTGSVIVAFPIETRDGVLLKEQDTAEKAVERVVNLFNNWVLAGDRGLENVTHNISNTIVVRADEWDSIPDMLFKYRNMIGGISLIGDFGDKAYPFAPLSSIPDSKWVQDYRDKNPSGFDELIKLANDCQKYGFDFNEMISYYDYYAQLDMRAVYAWYCYDKITSSYTGKINWSELKSDDKENVGNMAAVSCSGGGCTIL